MPIRGSVYGMPKLRVCVALLALFLPVSASALVRPIAFPVAGSANFQDDFADPRANGTREHLGIDIMAAKMTPVVAATDGTVSYVVSPQASWGYSVSIRDAEGYQYRYLHLNNDTPGTDDGLGGEANAYAPGIRRGVRVVQGDILGYVGDSGNAEGTAPHLHFEIRTPDRTPVSPYESLVAAATTRSDVNVSGSRAPSATAAKDASNADLGISSAFKFTKPLSIRSRNDDVRELQIRLRALGYFTYPEITGYFGSITQAAVIAFQRANGIDPIGIVGPLTRAALNSV